MGVPANEPSEPEGGAAFLTAGLAKRFAQLVGAVLVGGLARPVLALETSASAVSFTGEGAEPFTTSFDPPSESLPGRIGSDMLDGTGPEATFRSLGWSSAAATGWADVMLALGDFDVAKGRESWGLVDVSAELSFVNSTFRGELATAAVASAVVSTGFRAVLCWSAGKIGNETAWLSEWRGRLLRLERCVRVGKLRSGRESQGS